MAKWTVEKRSPMCLYVDVELPSIGDKFVSLHQSDVHWDHPKCQRKLYYKHLDEALDAGAPVFRYGDMFCLMQMPKDKRMTKGSTREEHNQVNYADLVVNDAVSQHEKYKDIIAGEGVGNHETAFIKMCGTNLVDRFAARMRDKGGICQAMGYGYWIFFRFTINRTKRVTKRLYAFHGKSGGGGAEVTKGTLNPSRWAGVIPDADIMVHGHIHEQWSFPITRWRINTHGVEWNDEQLHLQIPSYKSEVTNKPMGWAKEKGFKPQPLGAWWLEFEAVRRDIGGGVDVQILERRAK